jgi:hypothetical protein
MFKIPFCPPPTVENPEEFSSEFNDFVAQCLIKDPATRPSAADLAQVFRWQAIQLDAAIQLIVVVVAVAQMMQHPFIVNARADPHVLREVVERYTESAPVCDGSQQLVHHVWWWWWCRTYHAHAPRLGCIARAGWWSTDVIDNRHHKLTRRRYRRVRWHDACPR